MLVVTFFFGDYDIVQRLSECTNIPGDAITVKCASDYTLKGPSVLKCSQVLHQLTTNTFYRIQLNLSAKNIIFIYNLTLN